MKFRPSLLANEADYIANIGLASALCAASYAARPGKECCIDWTHRVLNTLQPTQLDVESKQVSLGLLAQGQRVSDLHTIRSNNSMDYLLCWLADKHTAHVYLTVRGTDERSEWLGVNFKADLVPMRLSSADTELERSSKRANRGLVHSGYLEAMYQSQIFDHLYDYIEQIRESRQDIMAVVLHVQGHSLGGGVASMIISDMLAHNYPIGQSATFGAPRCGDETWAAWFGQRSATRVARVVHGCDPVTHVPPSSKVAWLINKVTPSKLAALFADEDGNNGNVTIFDNYSHPDVPLWFLDSTTDDFEVQAGMQNLHIDPSIWAQLVDVLRDLPEDIKHAPNEGFEDHGIGHYASAFHQINQRNLVNAKHLLDHRPSNAMHLNIDQLCATRGGVALVVRCLTEWNDLLGPGILGIPYETLIAYAMDQGIDLPLRKNEYDQLYPVKA